MLTERQFTDAAEWYLGMVYRITLNWFRNPADAEDAFQDAMLCPWETDTDFQRGGAPVQADVRAPLAQAHGAP